MRHETRSRVRGRSDAEPDGRQLDRGVARKTAVDWRRVRHGGILDHRGYDSRRGAGDAGRNQNRESADPPGGLDRPRVRRFHRQVREEGRPAGDHIQPGCAGHPAGVSAGAAGAVRHERRSLAGDRGGQRRPGGGRAQAARAVGYLRPADRRSPAHRFNF